MKAKAFFEQVAKAAHDLGVVKKKLRRYRDIGYSISGGSMDSPVVSHSRGSSRVEASAIGMYETTREWEETEKRLAAVIHEAEKVIEQIPQQKFRDVLTFKYICGMSRESIADELGYKDKRSVNRAHGFALREAQKILNKAGDRQ